MHRLKQCYIRQNIAYFQEYISFPIGSNLYLFTPNYMNLSIAYFIIYYSASQHEAHQDCVGFKRENSEFA